MPRKPPRPQPEQKSEPYVHRTMLESRAVEQALAAQRIAHRQALKARRATERVAERVERERLQTLSEERTKIAIAARKNAIINTPPHYVQGRKYEPIDVILDWKLPYLEGHVVRYISRAERKGMRLTDLKKAQFYLNRAIAQLERIEHGGEDKAKE